jgi:GH18 family chitinase
LSAVTRARRHGLTRYLSYEDEASIIAKGEFSRQHGYAGTIVWTLAQGELPAAAADHRVPTAMTAALRTGFVQ